MQHLLCLADCHRTLFRISSQYIHVNSKLFVNTYKESKNILTNRNFNVIIVNRKIASEEPNERFR